METKTMSDVVEPNENSTTEEVRAYADQVVKEVEAERAGEEDKVDQKGDARITSEHADNEHKETPAEEPTGRDEAAEQGEETGEPEGQDWLTDEVKAEVAAYGIEESELADFASREELDRALRFFDKTALEAGRKAMAEGEETGPARNEKGQFTKAEEKEAPKADESGRFEVTLDKDVYHEDLVGEFTRMRDHYDSVVSSLESKVDQALAQLSEQQSLVEEQRFDAAVDDLNMPQLFGKTGSESQKEIQRRQDLMVQCKAQQLGLQQLTGRVTDIDQLVKRVAPFVFSDEFDKQKLKAHTRKITKQHNGRQGGGATRPQDPREDPRDEFDRLYRQLEGRT